MSFVQALDSTPREWFIIGAAVVVVGLFVVSLWTVFSRRRFVTIKRSEETELLAFHLRRIADALERLATTRESQASVDSAASNAVGVPIARR